MSNKNDHIEQVNRLARSARLRWLSLLSFLAFVGTTILGVDDADFFIASRQTELPLIGVSVPTQNFFVLAPLLGAALYSNLHYQLMKLWEACSPDRAPAVVSGVHFSDQIVSSFIAEMCLALRHDEALALRPLRRTNVWTTATLVFAVGPILLGILWWRSMPKHDELLTVVWCGLPFLFTLYVGLLSGLHMCRTARSKGTPKRTPVLYQLGAMTTAIGVSAVGWLTTEGTLTQYKSQWSGIARSAIHLLPWEGTERYLVTASLSNVYINEGLGDLVAYDDARFVRIPQYIRLCKSILK